MNELCLNYANALYGLLTPTQRQEALDALSRVTRDLAEDGEFARLLSSRNLSLEEKRDVIDAVYGKAFERIPSFTSFLKVVSDHHRLKEMPGINEAYRSLVHADLGIKEGIAYSAERLSEAQLAALEQAIGERIGSKVSLHNVTDHNLLGGVKVAVDGKVFDGTLANKLSHLRNQLNGGIQP